MDLDRGYRTHTLKALQDRTVSFRYVLSAAPALPTAVALHDPAFTLHPHPVPHIYQEQGFATPVL